MGYFLYKDKEYEQIIKDFNRGVKIEIYPSEGYVEESANNLNLRFTYNEFMRSIGEPISVRNKIDLSVLDVAISISEILENINDDVEGNPKVTESNDEFEFTYESFMKSIGEQISGNEVGFSAVEVVISVAEIVEDININQVSFKRKSATIESKENFKDAYDLGIITGEIDTSDEFDLSIVDIATTISEIVEELNDGEFEDGQPHEFEFSNLEGRESNPRPDLERKTPEMNRSNQKSLIGNRNSDYLHGFDYFSKYIVLFTYLNLILLLAASLSKGFLLPGSYFIILLVVTIFAVTISLLANR